jgi:eukaryotic-like serine/threonine-protein kinase
MDKDLAANTPLSHYRIERKLGAGGMAEVYLAHDTRLQRPVALKLLPAAYTVDRTRLQRFEQEACAASALNHPNILTVYEIGVENGTHFIATEHVDGVTLRQKLREARLSPAEAIGVSHQIAVALTAAHAAGVIHRDIKPENIMLRHDQVVKVLDFGLAKLTTADDRPDGDRAHTRAVLKTDPGLVQGTACYMSPEQARGLDTDERTDVWSLGVVLYEMIAGCVPFDGETMSHVTVSILEHDPAPLERFAPDAPAELEHIVRRCLSKKREDRYQTAGELAVALSTVRRRLDLQNEREHFAGSLGVDVSAQPAGLDMAGPALGRGAAHTMSTPGPGSRTDAGRGSRLEHHATAIRRHKTAVILSALAACATLAAALALVSSDVRPVRALTERDTILLTDFVNTTGDAVFDGTLKQALTVQLGQSPFLTMFSEDRVRDALRFMGRAPDERVTREVAREICQRQGLKAMLAGSIASLGNQYVITLEAINAQTGDAIALQQVDAESKEQVLRALGRATTRLREELGESLASIQKFDAPIEQATTSSLEAFKAFSLGFERQLNGSYFEAIPLYRRAAEGDPDFALAYARLASVYSNTGEYGLAAEASQRAYHLRDRVSERERLYISMSYFSNVTGEVDEYIETLEVWKRTYPRDVVPRNNLALQYNDIGRYERALDEATDAIRLNPQAAPPRSNRARALAGLSRFDEARETIEQAVAQNVETLFMHRLLYFIAFIEGDDAGMQQQIEWVSGRPEEYTAQNWQADTAAFSGRLRTAAEFSRRAAELAQRRDLTEVLAQIVAGEAAREAHFGNCTRVKEKTARALAITESQRAMFTAANALAACGEFKQMQAITDDLVRTYPKDTLLNDLLLPLVQARAEMYRGHADRAIQLLETTRSYEGAVFFQIPYLRGEAYLAQRKGAEAAAEFQRILDNRGWQPASPLYPLAHLGLARAAMLTGDAAKARRAYEDLFALWKNADPDIAALQQARREHVKVR